MARDLQQHASEHALLIHRVHQRRHRLRQHAPVLVLAVQLLLLLHLRHRLTHDQQKQHRFLEIAFYVLLTVFAFTLSKYAHLLLERLQDVEKVALYA